MRPQLGWLARAAARAIVLAPARRAPPVAHKHIHPCSSRLHGTAAAAALAAALVLLESLQRRLAHTQKDFFHEHAAVQLTVEKSTILPINIIIIFVTLVDPPTLFKLSCTIDDHRAQPSSCQLVDLNQLLRDKNRQLTSV